MSAYQQDDVYYPQGSAPPQDGSHPYPQSYGSTPAGGNFGLTWVEPSGKNAIIAALLGLLGLLPIPLIGFGHLYLGQRGKFWYFMAMGLATLLLLIGIVIPGVNAFVMIGMLVAKITLTVVAVIDAYQIGVRLQEGRPVAAGECSLVALPLGRYFVKEPVFVSGSEDAPAEYKARLGTNV